MIQPKQLLADLQRLLKRLEDDVRRRCDERPEINRRVEAEYAKARAAKRTAQVFAVWRDEFITQVAAAWVLACVFVRFLEDNELVDPPRLAGTGARLKRARDEHQLYFRRHPLHSDREYFEYVFREAAKLPAVSELFDERHNPLWALAPSGDGATALLDFWQQIDPNTGALVHDFTDDGWNTRFLGDLYQDLSEAARKKYALLQTPRFVEEFILDRTLGPAIDEFGYKAVRVIDPTCGSGHFLLGTFQRLLDLRLTNEPGAQMRYAIQCVLDQVYGVDLNPFAASIARFRLLVAALREEGIKRLQDAPAFRINIATGDSLLHGGRPERGVARQLIGDDALKHVYETEDAEALERILQPHSYHVVVGNPPYITVKDAALNSAYRQRFGSCHMKYSLAVPFMERFFDLAVVVESKVQSPRSKVQGQDTVSELETLDFGLWTAAGFVGMITANSFMKREFGKKLIERYIPRWDLTHVIDTSGAYIPGHGTPTVILYGRNRQPVDERVRAVLGIKGEPATPEDAARGLVWRAIVEGVDVPDFASEFVSVTDAPRAGFHQHPWSIGGGGAAELKEVIDEAAEKKLGEVATSIGITSFTLEDDIYLLPGSATMRHGLNASHFREMVEGEVLRDWVMGENHVAVFPYDDGFKPIKDDAQEPRLHYLWRARTMVANNKMFGGKTKVECGLKWFEFGRLTTDKLRTPLSITLAEVATHNHFVLDRGGKVFKQTAPVIKLPASASEDEHLALLGLLNSSTACFWLKQVCFPKGGDHVGTEGARVRRSLWDERFAHDSTKIKQFPIPQNKPLDLARTLDALARELQETLPDALARRAVPNKSAWQQAEQRASDLRRQMIALQEELDWQCYELYKLINHEEAQKTTKPENQNPQNLSCFFVPFRGYEIPPINLGQRAFEIVMARKMAAGELETTWFARHNSTPAATLPADWPAPYRATVERRIELIETNPSIRLIEQPEYKRRWNYEPWDEQAKRALRRWLLDRLETFCAAGQPELTSAARISDRVRTDAEFMQTAEMYRAQQAFDLGKLVAELIVAEAVPFLPVLRYRASGLRNRRLWEETWEKQREEDRIRDSHEKARRNTKREEAKEGDTEREEGKLSEAEEREVKEAIAREVGDILVPPKYKSSDFLDANLWRLRGKLDVPKERFISYPHLERDADRALPVLWAGFNHLQQAHALAAFYTRAKDLEGWTAARLVPTLAGLGELLPWLRQWHNQLDPEYNLHMGDYFADFLDQEARALGLTVEDVKQWKP